MLSIIAYGRNDSHGGNLSKRMAISLNCMAQILDHENDEIIFIDYNTPNELPTVIEAIADTLTDRAKSLLRVFRIRPEWHDKMVGGKTHLKAIEPFARNAAIQKSNKANPWILSTNTDMIFVPRGELSLSRLVRQLEEGFYGLPRFELPEFIWESLNRSEPAKNIELAASYARPFCLNEVVHNDKILLYDAPGDFQLFSRACLDKVRGFDETMLYGWHVDANFAKRMLLKGYPCRSLVSQLSGYHCSHYKNGTHFIRSSAKKNSKLRSYLRLKEEGIDDEKISDYESVEEVKLTTNRQSIDYLRAVLPYANSYESHESYIFPTNFNYLHFNATTAKVHLVNVLSSFPDHCKLIYVGAHEETLSFLQAYLTTQKKGGQVLVPSSLKRFYEKEVVTFVSDCEITGLSQNVICDFSTIFICRQENVNIPFKDLPDFDKELLLEVESLIVKLAFQPNSSGVKYVILNSARNRFDATISSLFDFSMTPYSAKIRICKVRKGLMQDQLFSLKRFLLRCVGKMKKRFLQVYCRDIKIDVPER